MIVKKYLFFSIEDRHKIFETIFKEIISVNKKKKDTLKSFDFLQDSQYIYAGFKQCYGMDLFEQRDKLHWWKFISLFSGLSSETRMVQIIGIRTQKLPKPTKYNAEERARIIRLKNEYRLEMSEEEREASLQSGLAKMAMVLEGMAKRKK